MENQNIQIKSSRILPNFVILVWAISIIVFIIGMAVAFTDTSGFGALILIPIVLIDLVLLILWLILKANIKKKISRGVDQGFEIKVRKVIGRFILWKWIFIIGFFFVLRRLMFYI